MAKTSIFVVVPVDHLDKNVLYVGVGYTLKDLFTNIIIDNNTIKYCSFEKRLVRFL